MKALKFLATGAAAMLLCVVTLMAQPPHRGGEGRPEMDPAKQAAQMAQRMTQQLSLNATQTAELTKVFQAQFEQRAKDREANKAQCTKDSAQCKKMKGAKKGGDSTAMAARKTMMEKHRAEMDAQIKKILTDEQYQKWTAMQEKMRQRPGRPDGAGRPAGPGPDEE
ncbi:MAG: DUF4890 domain-containing protein [Alistipes sp.]|nr:DUF4890 domain-containing protein [Alistipes sp.]